MPVEKLVDGHWICGICGHDLETKGGSCADCRIRDRTETLKESAISKLDPWESAVFTPYKAGYRKPDKETEAPLLVAFDAECDSHTETVIHGGKSHDYKVQDLLCFTFAAWGRDGAVLVDRWDIEDEPTMVQLEDHIRDWLNEPGRVIRLITFWSLAELRHISDFKTYAKDHTLFVHESCMHVRTPSLKIIDALPYFGGVGLDAVAAFVGLKKIKLGNQPDGEPWIKHMRQLKTEHPEIFWPYAENDSVILLKAFSEFRKVMYETFKIEVLKNTFTSPTISSIAVHILRRDYLDYAVQPTVTRLEPTMRRLKDGSFVAGKDRRMEVLDQNTFLQNRRYALRSCGGGRRQTYGCGFYDKPVTRIDSSGHYNVSAMKQPLPNCKTVWLRLYGRENLDEILKCEGYVRLVEPYEKSEHPLLAKNPSYSKRLLFTKGDDEVYTTIFELRLALKYTNLHFKDIEAYGFVPTENEINNPLRQLMERFGKMKDEAAVEAAQLGIDKDNHLPYILSKLLSNALIGKFIQALESDRDAQEEFFELGLMNYDFVKPSRGKWSTPERRVSESAFAPEWSSLILGRGRGILGLTALLLKEPLTEHTDSVDFPTDLALEEAVIKQIFEEYGFTFKMSYRADGLWLMRSAVNIALHKRKDDKWEVFMKKQKDGSERPMMANHAIHLGHDRAQLYRPVCAALNGGVWDHDLKVSKESTVYPLSEKRHGGVHFGSSYPSEMSVHLMWDYKRELPPDFDVDRDLFTRFAWAPVYDTVRTSRLAEDIHDRKEVETERGPITHGPQPSENARAVLRLSTKQSKADKEAAYLKEIMGYLEVELSGNEIADKFAGRTSRATIHRLINRLKNAE